jgi:hypothetical protein
MSYAMLQDINITDKANTTLEHAIIDAINIFSMIEEGACLSK